MDVSSGLDAALAAASQRALSYEVQIKDLEVSSPVQPQEGFFVSCGRSSPQGKLAEDLSNSRAIDNLLREVVQGLQVSLPVSPRDAHPLTEILYAK